MKRSKFALISSIVFGLSLLVIDQSFASGQQGLDLRVRGNIDSNEIKPPYGDILNFSGTCLSTVVPNIDVDWDPNPANCPQDRFTAYYYGYIKAPVSGNVYFFDVSDDGFYMTIEDQTVIDNWVVQAFRLPNGSGYFNMKKDRIYRFKAWYFENDVGAGLHLYWNLKTNSFADSGTQIVPAHYFATDPTFWQSGEICEFKGNSSSANNFQGGLKSNSPASTKSNGAGSCQNSAIR